jgi:uncharacterized DUF497 family protein/uncharacterized protein (DUF4415 family)
VEFTWDTRKDRANRKKHRISFENAILVFDDPFQVTTQDREVEGEARWQTVGMVNGATSCWSPTHWTRSKTPSASSQRERRHGRNGGSILGATSRTRTNRKMKREVRIKRIAGRALTPRQKRELAARAALPDDKIDTSDIPELPLSAWKDAVRGKFYRPVKQAVSMRLDADVVAWLKSRAKAIRPEPTASCANAC